MKILDSDEIIIQIKDLYGDMYECTYVDLNLEILNWKKRENGESQFYSIWEYFLDKKLTLPAYMKNINEQRNTATFQLLILAWNYVDEMEVSARNPFVHCIDATCKTNKHNYKLIFNIGADSDSKNVVHYIALVSAENLQNFEMLLLFVYPVMYGSKLCLLAHVFLSDGDRNLCQAIDGAILLWYKNAIRRRCFWHAVYQWLLINYKAQRFSKEEAIGKIVQKCIKMACFQSETKMEYDEIMYEVL
eukprot:Pgem_evm2s11